jgi:hypothetical protein
MDYGKMWKCLNKEVDLLIQQKVESINPILLRGYMHFIEDRVFLRESVAAFEKGIQPQAGSNESGN